MLQQISWQNAVIAVAYFLISLLWSSLAVTLSVMAGALIAICSYSWLYGTLKMVVGQQTRRSVKKFQWHYGIRIVALGLVLFLLVFYVKVNPIALFIGLSVVVLSILIGILRFAIQAGR